ncbi:MAG: GNAT family N-acetyltransferase [Clostridia bacterium]|nr:GNAT family N-acetyltransferase [Clostridia bacterium]
MVELEQLNAHNEEQLLRIDRTGILEKFVEPVADTIALAKYGMEQGLEGFCFAIRQNGAYVGILLAGQALDDPADPEEIRGTRFFRILGFVIDRRYQGRGIGSEALKLAVKRVRETYGNVPFLLECDKDNHAARRFYEKNGFVSMGLSSPDNTDDFLILR